MGGCRRGRRRHPPETLSARDNPRNAVCGKELLFSLRCEGPSVVGISDAGLFCKVCWRVFVVD